MQNLIKTSEINSNAMKSTDIFLNLQSSMWIIYTNEHNIHKKIRKVDGGKTLNIF